MRLKCVIFSDVYQLSTIINRTPEANKSLRHVCEQKICGFRKTQHKQSRKGGCDSEFVRSKFAAVSLIREPDSKDQVVDSCRLAPITRVVCTAGSRFKTTGLRSDVCLSDVLNMVEPLPQTWHFHGGNADSHDEAVDFGVPNVQTQALEELATNLGLRHPDSGPKMAWCKVWSKPSSKKTCLV